MTSLENCAALSIIPHPDSELWRSIQDVRSIHDPHFERWMPHINICFPFLPFEEHKQAVEILQKEAKKIPVFEVNLRDPCIWKNGKNFVIVLKANTRDNLFTSKWGPNLQKLFPQCEKKREFIPHMTIANKKSHADAVKFVNELKLFSAQPSLSFTVSELVILTRTISTPFLVSHRIPLCSSLSPTPPVLAPPVSAPMEFKEIKEEKKQGTRSDMLYKNMKLIATRTLTSHPKSIIYRLAGLEKNEMFNAFLMGLPSSERARWTCRTCQEFLNSFGNLVLISDDNRIVSLFWDASAPGWDLFIQSIRNMEALIVSHQIGGVAFDSGTPRKLGKEHEGGFTHMFFQLPKIYQHTMMAHEYATLKPMLERVLLDYSLDTCSMVLGLLDRNQLESSDTHKPIIKWFHPIALAWAQNSKTWSAVTRDLFIWRNVGSSFVGSINSLRSGALSVLLQSIEAKDPLEVTRKKWSEISSPLYYLRPQALPSKGNVKQAEKKLAELKITEVDLERYLLKYNDEQLDVNSSAIIYASSYYHKNLKHLATEGKIEVKDEKSIFAGLLTKETKVKTFKPSQRNISRKVFIRDVLPSATHIEFKVPSVMSLYTFITGGAGTRPLMQWHTSENLVSWFTYLGGPFPCERYELKRETWTPVDLILWFPNVWKPSSMGSEKTSMGSEKTSMSSEKTKHGDHILVSLRDAKDSKCEGTESCLFPEYLKSEFHPFRATIEAYSKEHKLIDRDPLLRTVRGIKLGRSTGNALEGQYPPCFRITAPGYSRPVEFIVDSYE